jgi:hypothetical protein
VSLDNASVAVSPITVDATTTTTANPTRDRLDSALSLEGIDLELPTLDTYQEEYGMLTSKIKLPFSLRPAKCRVRDEAP